MAKNEAKIKFTAETGEFNDSIKKSNDELSKLKAELKLNEAQMDNAGKSVEGLEKKHDLLENQLKASQSKVEALAGKVEAATRIYGENSDEVTKLERQLANARTEEEKIKKAISECNNELDEQTEDFNEAGESAEGFNGKMAAVAAGVAAAGAALIEFGKNSIEAFNEVDEGADNIVKATGATGDAAAELEEVYKNVASSVVGDFADMGSAIGEINTRFGYTGSDLETASVKFQKFSEITGVDAKEAVQSVSRALNDAGIPLDEYDSLLDQLAKAGQAAGIDVTTLADSLSKNGSVMRSMGFNTEETIALLSNFELAGADASTMLSGMKKAMGTWADAGKDGNTEFANMVEGIKNGSVSASDAIDVFGTKAGPMLVDAIKSGKFEYQDMLAVIQNSKGTVETTFDGTVDGGYELELAMQNCKLAMAEVGGVVGEALTPVFQTLSTTIIPAVVDGFGALVEGIKGAVQWMKEHEGVVIAVAAVVGVLTAAITAYNIVQGVKAAMEAANVTTVWGLVSAHIAQAAAAMAAIAPYVLIVAAIAAVIAIIVLCIKHWDDIVAAVKNCIAKMSEAWKSFTSWLNSAVIQPVLNWFKNLWSGIQNVFSSVGSWFSSKFKAAKDGVLNAWSTVTAKFSSIKTAIVNAFSNVKQKISEPFEKARDAVKGVVDKIKGFFSNMKLSLPKIKLPHFKVTGKLSLNPPSVPKLTIDWYKDGGVMLSPTIFGVNGNRVMAGGEAGPEAIAPISTLQSYIMGAVEKAQQTIDISSLASAIEDLANRPAKFYVGDREIALATASASDSVNGLRNTFKSRGLIVD